jgi:integrase
MDPSGKQQQSWAIHVVERDPKGVEVEVRKAAPKGSDKGGARDYESAVRNAIREGRWCVPCKDFTQACRCAAAPASLDPTVEKFSATWQARNGRERAHGTVMFYAECLKVILPQLGTMLVKDVRFQHVEAFKAHLLERGYDKTTCNNILASLRAMLNYAEKSGVFGDGRAPRVELFDDEGGTGKYLTGEQEKALAEWVRKNAPEWYAMIVVMLATGLRIGEVIALEWRDLDMKTETLHVNRVYYRKQFAPAGDAQRAIPLESQAVRAIKQIPRKLDNRFVFPGRNNPHMTEASHRALFKRVTEFMKAKAGEGEASGHSGVEPYSRADNVTPHVLRHTFATRKVTEGVDMKVLSRLMGHASVTTTEIYAKVTDEALRAAMGKTKEGK